MKRATIVYNRAPILAPFVQTSFRFDGNVKKFFAKLNQEVLAKNIKWEIEIDDTIADIEELVSRGTDLIVCLPGLQKRIIYNSEDVDAMFLTSLEFNSNDVNRVINYMQTHEEVN